MRESTGGINSSWASVDKEEEEGEEVEEEEEIGRKRKLSPSLDS